MARHDVRRPLVPDCSRHDNYPDRQRCFDTYPDRPRRSDTDRSSPSPACRVTSSDIELIVRLQQRLQSLIAKALDYRPGNKKYPSAHFAADEVTVAYRR